jgi:hypothetical protein
MHPAIKRIYVSYLKFKSKLKNIDDKIFIDAGSWRGLGRDNETVEITGKNTYRVTGHYNKKSIRYIKDYKNDSLIKIVAFDESGNKKYEGQYVNSMKDGEWKYYTKGTLHKLRIFKNGIEQ